MAFWADTSGGQMIVRASQTDNDEDALFDHWESTGIDFDGNGTPDLPLHQSPFNANPNHKDIFVEIDFMRMQGHTHRPGGGGLDRVRNAFSSANVSNPDGNQGITLHNMVDEILREPTYLISGNPSPTPIPSPIPFLSRAQGVRNDFFDFKNGQPHNQCGTLDDDGHFGRIADRQSANCLNIIGGRRLVFRYAIFGHSFTECQDCSGVAELPGNDFFVTLRDPAILPQAFAVGCQLGETIPDCARRQAEMGTYMHEMGHTFNLRHGGNQYDNCKPNYLSVMNYSLQFPVIDHGRPLDFSRQALSNLDENSLNEPNGIGGPTGRRTASGDNGGAVTQPIGLYITPTNGAVDWNRNSSATDSSASQNINYVVQLGCRNSDDDDGIPDGLRVLSGQNDWQALQYSFRNSRDFSNGAFRDLPSSGQELLISDMYQLSTVLDTDSDGFADSVDSCIDLANSNQTDNDFDGFGDVCDSISSDISVSMTANPPRVRAGQPITYSISITNNGPVETARNIYIKDQFPATIKVVSVVPSSGECDEFDGDVQCRVEALSVGASITISITVIPNTATRFVNSIRVENGIGDTNQSNNTAMVTTSSWSTAAPRFDADGDGVADVVVWRPSEGMWYVLRSSDGGVIYQQWGTSGDKLVPGDYDGDGYTDFGIYRPSTTDWWILQSSNGAVAFSFGLQNDTPVPGDFDGDGRTDVAVFRPTDGYWWILRSSDGGVFTVQWGQSGDRPIRGDYDGDGETDIAIYRPNVSEWWIIKSSDGLTIQKQFGQSTDIVTPGDYDADGKTDYGVWRPSTGYWYTASITEQSPAQNFTSVAFGQSGDRPQPADFDGDGKTDRAVWRPSGGYWWILKSSDGGHFSLPWGLETDIIVTSAYFFD